MDAPSAKLSQEELNAFPENVRKYILVLEAELDSLKLSLNSNHAEPQRKHYSYSGR